MPWPKYRLCMLALIATIASASKPSLAEAPKPTSPTKQDLPAGRLSVEVKDGSLRLRNDGPGPVELKGVPGPNGTPIWVVGGQPTMQQAPVESDKDRLENKRLRQQAAAGESARRKLLLLGALVVLGILAATIWFTWPNRRATTPKSPK